MQKLINWKDSLLIVVGAAFALSGVWGWVLPIDQATAETIVNLLYQLALIIGGLLGGRVWVKAAYSKTTDIRSV